MRERGLTAQRQQARKRGGGSTDGKVLVDLKGVSVSYGARDVLVDVNWTIREGERWMLAGHNGAFSRCLMKILLMRVFRRIWQEYVAVDSTWRSSSLVHGGYHAVRPASRQNGYVDS